MDDLKWAMDVKVMPAYVQVSDEMAHDNGLCTCPGGVCTYQPTPLPALSWQTRVRYFLRRRWWGLKRLPGYRLAHKDDIGCDCG
jgi:hypothetical protein